MDGTRNERLFRAAKEVLPGGVSSPVRAFKTVGGTPLTIRRGLGARVWDADNREFVDFVCGWGAQILGHADPRVVRRIVRRVRRGTVFGAPSIEETQLARRILRALPGNDRVRFVSTGTEATMSALRLARAVTGREYIVKCSGCYHGHSDALLSSAGSGALTLGVPDSPGVPALWAAMTFTTPVNDLPAMRDLFAKHASRIAAVIVEPVVGNAGLIPPDADWLSGLREITQQHGALLVLDEVMTGFRVALGSAQSLYAKLIPGFAPDMSVFGKVIGGGMPLAAFGAKRAVMEQLAPLGPVYQAGTLSGNPVATACGLATLREIRKPGFHEALAAKTKTLVDGLLGAAREAGVPMVGDSEGGMFGFFFADALPQNYPAVMATDKERFNAFFHAMLDEGVYFAPALYEASFMSAAHSEADIAATIAAARKALKR